MKKYKNLEGNSGVYAYEIGLKSITLLFTNNTMYHYTYDSAGSKHIERMKILANEGRGLSSFINRYVKKRFASRLQ
jgi:hypothetical protein